MSKKRNPVPPSASEENRGSDGRLCAALVFIAAAAVYLNTPSNQFVYDDVPVILQNPAAAGNASWVQAFTSPSWSALEGDRAYRPLVTLSFSLTHTMTGPAPWAFHLGNILWHALASLLALVFLRQMGLGETVSCLAALLFALHPIHSEAVAGTVNRTETMAASFYLAALIFHMKQRPWVSGVLFLGALFSKESAVTLIAVLPFLNYDKKIKSYLPHLAALGVYFALRYQALSGLGLHSQVTHPLNNPLVELETIPALMNAFRVNLHYLWLLIFPLKLSADYSYNQFPMTAALSLPNLSALTIWAALVGAWAWSSKKHGKPAVFWGLFAFITFSVASNTVVLSGSIFAERLVYLPSLAFCVLAAWTLTRTAQRFQYLAWALAGLLCLFYAGRTWARGSQWRNQLTLFQSAARTCPRSMKALLNYGEALTGAGKTREALPVLQKAASIDPDRAPEELWSSLGSAQLELGKFNEAQASFQNALNKNPDYANAHYGLGYVYGENGNWKKSEYHFRKAAWIFPDSDRAHFSLGEALLKQGKKIEAQKEFEEALRLNPASPLIRKKLEDLR